METEWMEPEQALKLERVEARRFASDILQDLMHVMIANFEQKKITYEESMAADKACADMYLFPYTSPDETPFPPVDSKTDAIIRLKRLKELFPFFTGVYKKYAEQVEMPIYCIICGSELPRSARFCLDCGTKVTSPEEE